MAAETDRFVIASFALWAGDFDFVEKLLLEYSRPNDISSDKDEAQKPEDFIIKAGALRLRQLRQRREEFNKRAAEYAKQGTDLRDKPYIIETEHLRATLRRTDIRAFLMQGYLSDVSWEKDLFVRARRFARRDQPAEDRGKSIEKDIFVLDDDGVFKALGASWIIPGNPFIQVEVTDLGLIEASGLWTQDQLPKGVDDITAPFRKLLHDLDEPNLQR